MSIFRLAPLAFCTVAAAQDLRPAQIPETDIHKVEGNVRYGGTLHVASGTWTRGAAHARMLPGVLYSNTAQPTTFYSAIGPTGSAPSGYVVDDGQIVTMDMGKVIADHNRMSLELASEV